MLPTSAGLERTQALIFTLPIAANGCAYKDPTGPFGTLPKEVIGRIFAGLPVHTPAHGAATSAVCTSFAELSSPHRLAASLYAGADLRRGAPSVAERLARVGSTLAALARHAGTMEDKDKVAILDRLVAQIDCVPVGERLKVWRKLLDARSCLAQPDQPGYLLDCVKKLLGLITPGQPDKTLCCFKALLSVIADADAGASAATAGKLLNQALQAICCMDASVQQPAYAALLSTWGQLDYAIRSGGLYNLATTIFLVEESNRNDALEALLQLLPRLIDDEVCRVLSYLLKCSLGLSDPLKAKCMDAGMLLLDRVDGSAKRVVLEKLLVLCKTCLSIGLSDRYLPLLLARRASLPAM